MQVPFPLSSRPLYWPRFSGFDLHLHLSASGKTAGRTAEKRDELVPSHVTPSSGLGLVPAQANTLEKPGVSPSQTVEGLVVDIGARSDAAVAWQTRFYHSGGSRFHPISVVSASAVESVELLK